MKDVLKFLAFLGVILAWGCAVTVLFAVHNSSAITNTQDGFWHTITLTRGGKEYQVDVWCRIPLPTKEAPQKTILWTPPQP